MLWMILACGDVANNSGRSTNPKYSMACDNAPPLSSYGDMNEKAIGASTENIKYIWMEGPCCRVTKGYSIENDERFEMLN